MVLKALQDFTGYLNGFTVFFFLTRTAEQKIFLQKKKNEEKKSLWKIVSISQQLRTRYTILVSWAEKSRNNLHEFLNSL